MNILQVNKFFYMKGGSERYFFDISAALERAGHTVVHFSMKHPQNNPSRYSNYFIDEIDFQQHKTLSKAVHFLYSTEAAQKIRKLVLDTQPDIAHLHNISHQLTPSIIFTLKSMGIPIVQTVHDFQLICPNYQLFTEKNICERCKYHRYWNAIKHRCVQQSTIGSSLSAFEMTMHQCILRSYKTGVDRFISPSRFLQNTLVEWGWDRSKIVYIPHFVRKMHQLPVKKKNQVVFVGRLVFGKGAHVLLHAARHISKDIQIIFAGEGEEKIALQAYAKKHQLTHCQFVGFLQGKALHTLIQESRAMIVPTLLYENAPLVIYESLALGVPVIASRHGGCIELVNEWKTGFFFTPGKEKELADTIQRVIYTPSLQIPENQYTEALHLQRIIQLYEDILQKKDNNV